MGKNSSLWVCQQCGYESAGYLGRCPNCHSWASLVETARIVGNQGKNKGPQKVLLQATKLSAVPLNQTRRLPTQISELDRALGGGLVPGQVVLLAGDPGIGKSTLLLQLSSLMGNFAYIAGEESSFQIKARAQRLGLAEASTDILEATDIDQAIAILKDGHYQGVVVDSIQTMQTGDLSGLQGSVGQIRECASRLVRLAKESSLPVILVGHATKEGTVAGPNVLMHIVDTVLWFEGEKNTNLRILRARKNRFGPTDEVGVFEMGERGLESLTDPQKIFVATGNKTVPGSCVATVLQGTRPMLVEVQSLVVPTKQAYPKRLAQGLDAKRLEILLAVLINQTKLPFYRLDVFVNIVGGMKVNDPGCDLAVALSLVSAYKRKPLPRGITAIGEVELLGNLRPAPMQEKRVKEARRLGYDRPVTSQDHAYLSSAIKTLLG